MMQARITILSRDPQRRRQRRRRTSCQRLDAFGSSDISLRAVHIVSQPVSQHVFSSERFDLLGRCLCWFHVMGVKSALRLSAKRDKTSHRHASSQYISQTSHSSFAHTVQFSHNVSIAHGAPTSSNCDNGGKSFYANVTHTPETVHCFSSFDNSAAVKSCIKAVIGSFSLTLSKVLLPKKSFRLWSLRALLQFRRQRWPRFLNCEVERKTKFGLWVTCK
jgi:hypothetical protein